MTGNVKIYNHFFLFGIVLTMSSCYASVENTGAQTQIVGGKIVSTSSDENAQVAASTISLRTLTKRLPDGTFEGKQGCTATILSPTTAVTAAHCFETSSLALDMFDGTLFAVFSADSSKATLDSMRQVTAIATSNLSNSQDVNDLFKSGGSPINDIAVIRFEEGLPNVFRPVDLLKSTNALPKGTKLIVAGFGSTDEADEKASDGKLRFFNSLVDSDGVLTPDTIVHQGKTTGPLSINREGAAVERVERPESVCSGDSGGPAYIVSPGGSLQLAGVTAMVEMFKRVDPATGQLGKLSCAGRTVSVRVAPNAATILSVSSKLQALQGSDPRQFLFDRAGSLEELANR